MSASPLVPRGPMILLIAIAALGAALVHLGQTASLPLGGSAAPRKIQTLGAHLDECSHLPGSGGRASVICRGGGDVLRRGSAYFVRPPGSPPRD